MMDQKLVELMADLKEEETAARVKELVDAKTDPLEILAAARAAMEIVGKRFETFEYFIPDLVMAGEILTAIIGNRQAPSDQRRGGSQERAGPDRHRGRGYPRHRQGYRHLHAGGERL